MPGKPRWPFAAAIAICVAAAALRLWQARESLWLDELHTAWCAEGSLGEVVSRAGIGNQSPFFFWLEWLLIRVVGPSELSLRLPSMLAGTLLPVAVYWLAARWASNSVALVAAGLVAVDPQSIFYGTEARPYALVQLLSVVQIAVTIELFTQPNQWLRAAWILLVALLFHLHYTAALLVPAELFFYGLIGLMLPRVIGYRWTSLAIDVAILAVLCIPAIGNVLLVYSRRGNWVAFVPQNPIWVVLLWWPWALAAWYAVAVIVADRATNRNMSVFATLLLCWLFVPPLIAWMTTASDFARLFFPRYLLASAPAIPLIAALAVELVAGNWSKILVGLAIFLASLANSGMIEQFRQDGRLVAYRTEDWRGAIAWLNDNLQSTQFPVLVYSGLIEADGLTSSHDELLEDYCLFPVTSLYLLDVDRGDLFPLATREPGKLNQVAEMLVIHRGGGWLIVRGSEGTARGVAAQIKSELERKNPAAGSNKWHLNEIRSFGKVHILKLTADAL